MAQNGFGQKRRRQEEEEDAKDILSEQGTDDYAQEDAGDTIVSLVDVIKEDEELENEATAVLGASDSERCSYTDGFAKRQALYACVTCTPRGAVPAGMCLACSYTCHEGHDLHELYTKRNFRCDCGNSKFPDMTCKLYEDKDPINKENKYNHNFEGLYCICDRPYPDQDDEVPDEMIQCIICEDWYHGRHLGAAPPETGDYQEMVCGGCMGQFPFLEAYAVKSAVVKMDHEADTIPVHSSKRGNVMPLKKELSDVQDVLSCSVKVEVTSDDECSSTTPDRSIDDDGSKSNGDISSQMLKSVKKEEYDEDDEDKKPVNSCLLADLQTCFKKPAKPTVTYWPFGWRDKLCTCHSCLDMYQREGLAFLLEPCDTIVEYEKQGLQQQWGGSGSVDPLLKALNSLDRVQQVELICEYNELKTELMDYLKGFADQGKVVRKEDIEQFFQGMHSRKRRRMEGNNVPYYCK
uniref:putative E3 ubiquitin-protein ligase UBR7 n=1 Tax=Myxine glutinosa TaxID=7769 RepID=UPI00358E95B2